MYFIFNILLIIYNIVKYNKYYYIASALWIALREAKQNSGLMRRNLSLLFIAPLSPNSPSLHLCIIIHLWLNLSNQQPRWRWLCVTRNAELADFGLAPFPAEQRIIAIFF
jgi:hypothetical protein